jgi:hypothetical protein
LFFFPAFLPLDYQSVLTPREQEVNHYGLDGTMFNAPHLSNLADPDPEHWVNEWGFELIKKWD